MGLHDISIKSFRIILPLSSHNLLNCHVYFVILFDNADIQNSWKKNLKGVHHSNIRQLSSHWAHLGFQLSLHSNSILWITTRNAAFDSTTVPPPWHSYKKRRVNFHFRNQCLPPSRRPRPHCLYLFASAWGTSSRLSQTLPSVSPAQLAFFHRATPRILGFWWLPRQHRLSRCLSTTSAILDTKHSMSVTRSALSSSSVPHGQWPPELCAKCSEAN